MFSLGIDFGGTSIKTGVTVNGALIQRGPLIDTMKSGDRDSLLAAILEAIAELRAAFPGIAAIGIGFPGLVDSVNGIVRELSNVAGWVNVPMRDILHQATGLPVAIENDAKAMTYAEWKFGAGRGFSHLVCITLGTGVGGGLILNGQPYKGASLGAGEIGQMHYSSSGSPAGHYGNSGALEKLVGNKEITERARERYALAGRAMDCGDASPATLAGHAHAGDTLAQSIWDEIGTEIGVVLSDLVWLLNPEAIVLGGGVAKAGELLFDPIRRTIRNRTAAAIHENLQILPATLGNDAGIIGNAALGLEAV